MKIGFFGPLGELIGREVELEGPGIERVADLRDRLAAAYPEAAGLLANPGVRACIDDRFVPDDTNLTGIDIVEFLPPLSGG